MRTFMISLLLFFQVTETLFGCGAQFLLTRQDGGFKIMVSSYRRGDSIERSALDSPALLLEQLNELKMTKKNEDYSRLILDCPGIFFNECTREDCALNRLLHPEVRERAQRQIIAGIQERFPNKSSVITIASFGSGDLFQDFVLCSHLKALGYENVRIDLIDNKWTYVADLFSNKSNVHQNLIPGSFDFLDTQTVSGNDMAAQQLARLIQFRHLLPRDWSVRVYSSVGDLNLGQSGPLYDCVLGIDYGEPEYCRKTPLDFDNLLLLGLKPGGIAFDFNSNVKSGNLYSYMCIEPVPENVSHLYRELRFLETKVSLNLLAYLTKNEESSEHGSKELLAQIKKIHSQLASLQSGSYGQMNPLKLWLPREFSKICWSD